MKSILIKAYMCADILSNYIEDLKILEISVLNYKDVTPKHLVPNNYRGAEYLVKIEFEEQSNKEFNQALHKAKQAIYKAIGCESEPIRETQKFNDFKRTNTFVLLTAE